MADSTLLLADDSVTIQKVVDLTFAGEGINVVPVNDGNSALDAIREDVPALVMADVNLPGVNGYEICQQIRSMEHGHEVPVILLVGSFEPFDEEEANRVGANSYLTKPFESIASLVELVNGYLGSTEETQEDRRQVFEETVEYPTSENMVVSASSIPLAGGFEDETIEAEQYGVDEGVSETAEEAQYVEADDYASAPTERFDEGQHDIAREEEIEYETVGSSEPVYADHSEPEEIEVEEQASEEFSEVGYAESEFAEPFEPESPVDETVSDADAVEDIGERTVELPPSELERYEQSYQEEGATETDVGPEFSEHEGSQETAEEKFEPVPFEGGEGVTDTADLGSMTVELDEADLLELPIDADTLGIDPPEIEDQRSSHSGSETFGGYSGDVSEEMIEEIVRKVVERMSDKAVREIAWEVVPEMAELIISKMTEQKLNE